MPIFDQNRSPKLFIEAGSKAYRAGIRIKGNPYTNNNQRELWKKGWTRARMQELAHKKQYSHYLCDPKQPAATRQLQRIGGGNRNRRQLIALNLGSIRLPHKQKG
jgi:ribosome modulation factor